MNKKDFRKNLFNTFSSLNEVINIDYLEIIIVSKISVDIENKSKQEESEKQNEFEKEYKSESIFSKKFNDSFNEIPFKEISSSLESENETKNINKKIKFSEKEINCFISPLIINKKFLGYSILQSEKDFGSNSDKLLEFLAQIISITEEMIYLTGEDKYKKELNNLREIQAKLFPKFDNIGEFDIASSYLPADLMSGNFIDGTYLDDTTYQITACDISGYDSGSSFAGATIRTLIKSFSSKNYVPSAMINVITEKLNSIISGIHSIISLTLYQLNTKNGNVKLSYLSEISTLLYVKKRNRIVSLQDLKKGPSNNSSEYRKDLSIPLESGDILLYFSKGVVDAASGDGKINYGSQQLKIDLNEEKENSSVEILQNLTANIYDFTDYSPVENDMIMICIKKK